MTTFAALDDPQAARAYTAGSRRWIQAAHTLTLAGMPRIPDELLSRPFTTRYAGTLGVSKTILQGKRWRQVLRGVWVHRDLPDTRELRLAAVRLVLGDGAFICGPTAAWVYGIDVMHVKAKHVWVGCLPGQRIRPRAGCVVQQLNVAADDLVELDGALITSPVRTAFDCARWLPLVEGVVVADALGHSRKLEAAEFASYVAMHRGVRGVRRADQVVDLMDARSESPMESRVRVLLVTSGLPRPEPQFEILDVGDVFVARADLAYPRHRVAVEYDGAWHFEQRRDDDRRRDGMRDLGWNVIVVSAKDYFQMPWAIVAKVRNALADAAV